MAGKGHGHLLSPSYRYSAGAVRRRMAAQRDDSPRTAAAAGAYFPCCARRAENSPALMAPEAQAGNNDDMMILVVDDPDQPPPAGGSAGVARLPVRDRERRIDALNVLSKQHSISCSATSTCHMDGYRLTQRIRQLGLTLPVIGVTANARRKRSSAVWNRGWTVVCPPVTLDVLKQTLTVYAARVRKGREYERLAGARRRGRRDLSVALSETEER